MVDRHNKAFEFKIGENIPWLIVYHRDPEINDCVDSCGWNLASISYDEMMFAESLIKNAVGEYSPIVDWFPGYHPNCAIARIIRLIRLYKTYKRPWWRHPRYHIHHLRFQFPYYEIWNRNTFTRCTICNQKFDPKETPQTSDYKSIRKKWGWIGGESDLYHGHCIDDGQ